MAYHTAAANHLPEHQDAGIVPFLFKGGIKALTTDELTSLLMEVSPPRKFQYINWQLETAP
jgi:hypothetical protein